jgi:hypothetical protein
LKDSNVSDPAEEEAAQDMGSTTLESRIETRGPSRPERVNGRYSIGRLLGEGGMAAVYQATDLATGREVALKQFTLPREDRHYEESARLFEHEFSTLAQLSHPRIIEVYDYSVAETGPYYTMELIDGGDLRERTPMLVPRVDSLTKAGAPRRQPAQHTLPSRRRGEAHRLRRAGADGAR